MERICPGCDLLGADTERPHCELGAQASELVTALVFSAGSLAAAFVNAYAALAIGCTLGLAVFKRATELGWY